MSNQLSGLLCPMIVISSKLNKKSWKRFQTSLNFQSSHLAKNPPRLPSQVPACHPLILRLQAPRKNHPRKKIKIRMVDGMAFMIDKRLSLNPRSSKRTLMRAQQTLALVSFKKTSSILKRTTWQRLMMLKSSKYSIVILIWNLISLMQFVNWPWKMLIWHLMRSLGSGKSTFPMRMTTLCTRNTLSLLGATMLVTRARS